ncbi:MAG: nickel pincer cofactor biosynthesis protein LarC [Candidatus Caldatribacteriaceae bacterium]
MKILYLDCFSGISGDMFLGALLDLGIEVNSFITALKSFVPLPFEVVVKRVNKGGIMATKVDVLEPHSPSARSGKELLDLLWKGSAPEALKEKASSIVQKIIEAEGKIHGIPSLETHLHEVGGADTLVDVMGVVYGLELLGVRGVYSSPLPVGRGFVHTDHGVLPIPAPATLELLRGVPIYLGQEEGELTTPTGAALVGSLVHSFGSYPQMIVERIGYGAGTKDYSLPNVLRVILGEKEESTVQEKNIVLETNIDDVSPQVIGYLTERLFEAGALDVFVTPIYMKKQRPAFMVSVLATPSSAPRLRNLLFEETTTLGLREYEVTKWALLRQNVSFATPWGEARGKAVHKGGRKYIFPEYEDCKRIASLYHLPLFEVIRELTKSAPEEDKASPERTKK